MANQPAESLPAEGWFIARNREQDGPFSATRLRQMAKQGWLAPDDLVWHQSLPAWTPARQIEELFPGHIGRSLARALVKRLHGALPGRIHRPKPRATSADAATAEPQEQRHPRRRRSHVLPSGAQRPPTVDFGDVRGRHLVAIAGALLTALGLAFLTITPTPLARGLVAGGLTLAVAGLAPEIVTLMARAAIGLDRMRQEAAERRIRARELELEQQRLDVEAQRLAEEQRRAAASWSTPPQPARVVVVREEPVQRWNRGVAVLSSIVLPGLGHGYKGEIAVGVVWFVVVMLAYGSLTVLGFALHACCVISAATGAAWTEGRTTVLRD